MKAYSTKPDNSPPFVVFGDALKGGRISFGKLVDARCLPALLLPCPYARKRVKLAFPHIPESSQLELASELMGAAGVKVKISGKGIEVPNQPYRAFDAQVPPDIAMAAPFVVAAALTDSELKIAYPARVTGRDAVFLDILKKMGITLQRLRKGFIISGPQRPRATNIDLSNVPELLPIVAVLACKAKGKTTIKGAGEARGMKSDRISAMARGLRRIRARVVEHRDGLLIMGPTEFRGGEVDGNDDYAVVAALAVAGLLAAEEVKIKNRAEALQTSYSRFVSTFQELGANMSYAV